MPLVLQVFVEAVAAKQVEESAPLSTPVAWQSYRSDFNKDDGELSMYVPLSAKREPACWSSPPGLWQFIAQRCFHFPFSGAYTWLVFNTGSCGGMAATPPSRNSGSHAYTNRLPVAGC